ncbi:CD276 antigen-like isoform X2 [Rhinatrema bivittatum]|uniref:CD276 antigen-like isoform X2 n=1 Tax=Rhinatrema bivittatum TaxID=194408 RepID=UPI00112C8C0A|nr:CD276 antigen-like isoform X2 [Rhinatrema bivittatum]XP_029437074.1 CD276 antigen-like isoform X2 [Rhinatrema bivittatum]
MPGLWHVAGSLGYLLALLIHSGQLFKVDTGDSPLVAHAGDKITLPCHFFAEATDDLIVQWNFLGQTNVYLYSKGKEELEHQGSQFQARTWFNASGLPEGNASLVLSNISVSDEGNYNCFVSNSLDRGDGNVAMHVVVLYKKISVTCLPLHWNLTSPGDNVTLLCQALRGYPRPQLKWSINGTSVPESGGDTTRGPDQTFSVQSQLVIPARFIRQAECTLENRQAKEVLRAHLSSDCAAPDGDVTMKQVCVACGLHEPSPQAHKGIILSVTLGGWLLCFIVLLIIGCK